MQMKQGEQYTCNQCGCDVTVTVAPSVAGKGGQGSLVCCGEKMSIKSDEKDEGAREILTEVKGLMAQTPTAKSARP